MYTERAECARPETRVRAAKTTNTRLLNNLRQGLKQTPDSPVVELDQLVGPFRLAFGLQAQGLRVQREYVLELVRRALDEERGRVHDFKLAGG